MESIHKAIGTGYIKGQKAEWKGQMTSFALIPLHLIISLITINRKILVRNLKTLSSEMKNKLQTKVK